MCRDANDSGTREQRKLALLELLRDEPRDHIATGPVPAAQALHDRLPADVPLERDLQHHKRLRQRALVVLYRGQEHKQVVRGRVREQLQVVRLVLIMARHVQRHHALQEHLARRVEAEQRVARHVEQLALRGVRRAVRAAPRHQRRVQAEQAVEPPLDLVARRVPDWRLQLDLAQRACLGRGFRERLLGGAGGGRLFYLSGGVFCEGGACAFAQLLNELERERPAGTFVSVDGRGHEDEVWANKVPHEGKRNGGSFINDHKLCLAQNMGVLRLYVL